MKLVMTEKTFLYFMVVLQSELAWVLYCIMKPTMQIGWGYLHSVNENFDLGIIYQIQIISFILICITGVFVAVMVLYIFSTYLINYNKFLWRNDRCVRKRKRQIDWL